MALTVATNTGALMAQAAASSVNKEMEISMERLATGKRLNSASDDAAGVAIASRLTSEIKGTNQAIRNAMDGQAMVDTAEGAHQEIESILQRMRELAVQAANDTNDANDRANLQLELDALTDEIDRISSVTSWAGQSILSGTGGTGSNGQFAFQVGSQTNSADTITATINSMSAASLGVGEGNAIASATAASMSTVGGNVLQMSGAVVSGDVFNFDLNGDTVQITVGTVGDVSGGTIAYNVEVYKGGDTSAEQHSGDGTITMTEAKGITVGAAEMVAAVVNALDADGKGHRGVLAVADSSDGSVTITQANTISASTYEGSGATASISDNVTTLTFASGDLSLASGDAIALTINGESAASTVIDTDNYAETAGGLAAQLQVELNADSASSTGDLKGLSFSVSDADDDGDVDIEITASVTLANVSTTNAAATESLSITSASTATAAISAIDTAIQSVNSQRASLGAISNRLDSTVSNLTNISSNLQAGRGRIEDADFAAETTSLAKSQILQQASTAMLAQANASKQNVLSLLQG
ncbi:flagellin [Paracoccaceae bacterium]|nr:flagellin [Paracoccaceae bacterium]